jgi:hypothetical protein
MHVSTFHKYNLIVPARDQESVRRSDSRPLRSSASAT